MRTVFVLGAGFSRAISDYMPLTDELGNKIREEIPEAAARSRGGFKGGYFEAWLSRLAESQPDLTDYENHTNYALFLKITEQMHQLMSDREYFTLKSTPPWWLCRLVGVMHATWSPAITFNYDTLIERTVDHLTLSDWKWAEAITGLDVVRGIPPFPPTPARWGGEDRQTFWLLKLHGSLDSYWVPGDMSGATINRWELAGQWGAPDDIDDFARRRALPGRSPFIVPPAAAKSSFYNNPISRELWRSAANELRTADRVALVGYSLPPTDLVTSGMLVDAIGRRQVRVDVVNLEPESIKERLVRLGIPKARIKTHGGLDAINRYTDDLEHESGLDITGQLKKADGDALLMVATSEQRAARVTGFERRHDGTYLQIDSVTTTGQASMVGQGKTQATVSTDDLLRSLAESGDILKVRYADGSVAVIVSLAQWATEIGLGNGRWTILVPSAMPAAT